MGYTNIGNKFIGISMVTNLEKSNFDTEILGQSGFSQIFGVFFIVIFLALFVYGPKY